MPATEDCPASPRLDTVCPEADFTEMLTEVEPLSRPTSPREVHAPYDMGVAWTETDAKHEWPAKVLSIKVARFAWSFGIRALMAERERVGKFESLRFVFGWGYMANQTMDRIFTVPLSFQESFVGSHAERIALIDRVRTHYNFNWKRDAKAFVQHSRNGTARGRGVACCAGQGCPFEAQLENLKREADRLFSQRIEDLFVLQGLTEELKPETRELIKRCSSHEQLARCMLDANFESM
jgi:hypothetical protein